MVRRWDQNTHAQHKEGVGKGLGVVYVGCIYATKFQNVPGSLGAIRAFPH